MLSFTWTIDVRMPPILKPGLRYLILQILAQHRHIIDGLCVDRLCFVAEQDGAIKNSVPGHAGPCLQQEILSKLEANSKRLCVTISLNTHRTFPENAQDKIRLKNLSDRARDRLDGISDRRALPALFGR